VRSILARVLLDDSSNSWNGVLANIDVTTFNDSIDGGDTTSITNLLSNPGSDGISLREAIIASNNDSGSDTITLGEGTYVLEIPGRDEDLSITGDLDIRDSVNIVGAGPDKTVINGAGVDRLFEVTKNASHTILISDVKIQNGLVYNVGAAIFIGDTDPVDTTVNLSNVWFSENRTSGNLDSGGAIFNEAVLSIENSLFSDNSAGKGGAIFNKTLGTITITNSTLSGNTSGVEHGGGLFNAGDAYLTNVTVTDNTAQNSGGGIYVDPIAETVTQLSNTLVSNNIANGPVDISGQVTSPDGGNLVRDTNGVTGLHIDDITDENPFLSSLVDNGGSTPTHALLAESAAINSGVKSVAPLHDQRGVARDDQLPDIGAYEVANEASFKSLWLTTDGDVSSSSTMGINSWGKDTVAEFGNPNLNLGSNTTIGTFSEVVDFQIDNTGINALHYVGSEIVVGDDSFMILQKGDLILSVDKNGATLTSTNSIEVDRDDIFVFRPDVIGDYSQGTFILLLDGDQVSESINSITLIEERTDVGGKVLEKGSFLATYDSEVPSDNLQQ